MTRDFTENWDLNSKTILVNKSVWFSFWLFHPRASMWSVFKSIGKLCIQPHSNPTDSLKFYGLTTNKNPSCKNPSCPYASGDVNKAFDFLYHTSLPFIIKDAGSYLLTHTMCCCCHCYFHERIPLSYFQQFEWINEISLYQSWQRISCLVRVVKGENQNYVSK